MEEDASTFIVYRHYTRAGAQYRWRLKSSKGETLAWSDEGYPDRDACEYGLRRVRESYPESKIRDLTL